MEKKVVVGGLYRHYKGQMYHVLHRARESTNSRPERKPVVVYIGLTFGNVNVREEDEFLGTVLRQFADGIQTEPRFDLVKEP